MKAGSLILIHSKPRIDTNRTKLDPQYMHTNRLAPKRIEFARTDSQRINRIDSNRNKFTPPTLVYQEYGLPVRRFGFTRFDSQRIDRIESSRNNFTSPVPVRDESTEVCCHVLRTRKVLVSLFHGCWLPVVRIDCVQIESNRNVPQTNRLKFVATF